MWLWQTSMLTDIIKVSNHCYLYVNYGTFWRVLVLFGIFNSFHLFFGDVFSCIIWIITHTTTIKLLIFQKPKHYQSTRNKQETCMTVAVRCKTNWQIAKPITNLKTKSKFLNLQIWKCNVKSKNKIKIIKHNNNFRHFLVLWFVHLFLDFDIAFTDS